MNLVTMHYEQQMHLGVQQEGLMFFLARADLNLTNTMLELIQGGVAVFDVLCSATAHARLAQFVLPANVALQAQIAGQGAFRVRGTRMLLEFDDNPRYIRHLEE